jgi:hypothetical protein
VTVNVAEAWPPFKPVPRIFKVPNSAAGNAIVWPLALTAFFVLAAAMLNSGVFHVLSEPGKRYEEYA